MIPRGREFFKMSGSGNDFVFVDARTEPAEELTRPRAIKTICARATGIGADGIVLLERSKTATVGIRYYNADGSLASLCGNATLCTTRLAVELGAVGSGSGANEFTIETGSGVVAARLRDGAPEIDLQPVDEVAPEARISVIPGERRMGFALVGVPHLVVLTDDVEAVDVVGRGRPLRMHQSLRQGANVNFLAPDRTGGWTVRTYERGVEAETLACGTGAVASAILLTAWGLADGPISLRTRSGRTLTVRLRREGARWFTSLSGEGRIVFRGQLGELGLEDGASGGMVNAAEAAAAESV
jgi:diaminopimelate epimerase